jgi:drug/metabolite transporter (DMT)-like permease
MRSLPLSRRAGLGLALLAATVSGFSVYINGFAVKRAPSALIFTTAKNLVAAVLVASAFGALTARRPAPAGLRTLALRHWLGLAFVGVIGGGLAFALFFEGLARADTTQAAFVQKSLVLWVALLAVPVLGERLSWHHAVAIGLLLLGQLLLAGNIVQHRPSAALLLVLAATLLWAVEVLIARTLLRRVSATLLATVRMSVGSLALLVWLVVTHSLTQLGSLSHDWVWVLLTGGLLSGYVLSWFGALRRAPAVDVTAILVLGAFITALLSMTPARTLLGLQVAGLVLILCGVGTVMRARSPRDVASAGA